MSEKSQSNKRKNYVPRITQLDAVEFDQEIQNVLTLELFKIRKYLKPEILNIVKHEINLLLDFLIFYFSVINKNATFGQELLSLKYENNLSKKHFTILILLNYILPYLKNKFDDNLSKIQSSLIKDAIFKFEIFAKTCHFLNLLSFIREGKYPSLCDRILKLTYSSAHQLNQTIGYNYLTRELLWHSFMELLMYTLPLINYKVLKLQFKKAFTDASHLNKIKKKVNVNTETKCVICEDFPIIPCLISEYCPHLACYYCIKTNLLADEKFICPACRENNTVKNQLKFISLQ